ncbi:superoxide dismutase [Novosphingobium sp.]|uniref:superoxide dismutase n=1 Tax=Novosphingobium sp. TaxID=1874826 RepID=UPI0025EFFDD9|nr:superoxide dismutase [Novosphingobium sp.]
MAITLLPLPYAQDALEPAISAETIGFHYGKHHKGYVDKANAAIKGTPLDDANLNAVVKDAASSKDQKLFNAAAQAWNHGFYWHSLTPQSGKPGSALAAAIDASFGSFAAMTEKLLTEAEGHFGSGWAWLLADGDALSIATTHDAGCPLTGTARPLLVVDVWEHAYYLDRQNDRKAYLTAAAGLLNWNFADERFADPDFWVYPE